MGELLAAFGINWHLLIIQMVNFGVLFAALSYFLYSPITTMIDERRKAIAEGVRKAQEADRTLAAAKEEGEGLVGDAARQAEGLVAAARTRADERGAEILKDAESRAESIVADAHLRAAEAQRTALAESNKEIARAAMLAAERILREKRA